MFLGRLEGLRRCAQPVGLSWRVSESLGVGLNLYMALLPGLIFGRRLDRRVRTKGASTEGIILLFCL